MRAAKEGGPGGGGFLGGVMNAATTAAVKVFDCARCHVFQWDATLQALWRDHHIGGGAPIRTTATKEQDSALGEVLRTGRLVRETRETLEGAPAESCLVVPLVDEAGELVGAVQLVDKSEGAEGGTGFTPEDETLLLGYAVVLGGAMVHAAECAKVARERDQAAATLAATRAVSRQVSAADLFSAIWFQAEPMRCERLALYVADPAEDDLMTVNGNGAVERLPLEGTMAGIVATTGEPLTVDDVAALLAEAEEGGRKAVPPKGARNCVFVPVRGSGGKTAGVLQAVNRKEDPQASPSTAGKFSAEEAAALGVLAEAIAERLEAMRGSQLDMLKIDNVQGVLTSLNAAVLQLDGKGRAHCINEAMAELLDVPDAKLGAEPYDRWLGEANLVLVETIRTAYASRHRQVVHDVALAGPRGRSVRADVTVAPLKASDSARLRAVGAPPRRVEQVVLPPAEEGAGGDVATGVVVVVVVLTEEDRARAAFQRALSVKGATVALDQRLHLRPTVGKATTLYCAVRGGGTAARGDLYAKLAWTNQREALTRAVAPVVAKWWGVLDQFQGGAFLAHFGVPR
eukprot:504386-Prorocentrum_minimum.AAC.4